MDGRHFIARRLKGVYAITPKCRDLTALCAMCQAALQGGARLVQYRDEYSPPHERLNRARALLNLCRQYKAFLIINNDIDLALAANADGAHLGRDDGNIANARRYIGQQFIIGATCHARLDWAHAAIADGADYCAFGSVFSSTTKPQATHCPLSIITRAKIEGITPIVAIGGITKHNAAQVFSAGADAVAIGAGLFNESNIRAVTQKITAR